MLSSNSTVVNRGINVLLKNHGNGCVSSRVSSQSLLGDRQQLRRRWEEVLASLYCGTSNSENSKSFESRNSMLFADG